MKLTRTMAIAAGAAALAACLCGLAAFQLRQDADAKRNMAFAEMAEKAELSRALTASAYEIKLNVVQVQQWLTDISATRGLDGLNDGFEQAKIFAARLYVDVGEARALAAGLGDVTETLDAVETAFTPFYDQGVRMAQAYVMDGPAGGNAVMGDFGAAAERLTAALDGMLAEIEAAVAANRNGVAQLRQDAAAQEQTRGMVDAAGQALVLAILLGLAGFAVAAFQRFSHAAGIAAEIARGDYDAAGPGTSRWTELNTLYSAIEIFRENGKRLTELKMSEQELHARRDSERAEMMRSLRDAFGEVVDAASDGEFSKRVRAEFADPELNELAASVNRLVETVDQGLSESGRVLAALAQADLTLKVEGFYNGAFKRLKMDTNDVGKTLTEIVQRLRETSKGVRVATGEILSGANDLADRTTKQAATIEQTAATMDELAKTVQDNAQQAQTARDNSGSVFAAAEAGSGVMVEANAAMERITQSSSEISNIIGMIDDIAFQTNLLALNASVEAARAGEAGKGFAVVAIEVRRLAQSAADASQQVKALIERSAGEVETGSKLVGEAAGQLQKMRDAIRQNNGLIDAIASASRDQAASIEQVSAAVRQMDETTQHNAALVEETNAAIAQTESRAQELDRIVEVFKLGDAVTAGSEAELDAGFAETTATARASGF